MHGEEARNDAPTGFALDATSEEDDQATEDRSDGKD